MQTLRMNGCHGALCDIIKGTCKAIEPRDGLLHSGEDRLCNQNQTRRSGNLIKNVALISVCGFVRKTCIYLGC